MNKPSQPPVGIDLGTTFTVVAFLDAQGRPISIPNSEGDLTTPSVVSFDDSSIVVGKEALKSASLDPEHIAQWVKRDMGRPAFSQPINGEFLPPEVIQSLILERVKRDAEMRIGGFKDVVITVPAYFNEPRRKATQDAGQLAGLKVIDIINEPTAAAIAYGVQQGFLTNTGESQRTEKVLVYDLGGGTFDATLMVVDGKNYTVQATDGDVMLGGVDWDRRIVDYVAEEFNAKFSIDPRKDPAAYQRLLREAEDAKRGLTMRSQVTITFEHARQVIRVPLARQQFESLTADLLDRTRFTVVSLLEDSGTKWSDVTRLLLVGGSTRMPMVQAMLERESGKPVDRSLSVDEAVAHGAAIYAGLLMSGKDAPHSDMKVTDVNSHDLGVLGIEPQTGRLRNKVLIRKNTPLPALRAAQFRTKEKDQRSVVAKVIEGGDESGNHSTPIGECAIRDLPPNLPAGTPIEVTFSYAANGRLTVFARIPGLHREASLDIERASGLTDTRLDEWGTRLKNGLQKVAVPVAGKSSISPKRDDPPEKATSCPDSANGFATATSAMVPPALQPPNLPPMPNCRKPSPSPLPPPPNPPQLLRSPMATTSSPPHGALAAAVAFQPTMPAAAVIHRQRIAMAVASGAGLIAILLPWIQAPIVGSIAGVSTDDGKIVGACFVAGLLFSFTGRLREPLSVLLCVVTTAAGAFAAFCACVDFDSISRKNASHDPGFHFEILAGPGIYLAVAAAIAMLAIVSVVCYRGMLGRILMRCTPRG